MESLNNGFKSGEKGEGRIGCTIALFLMLIVIFLSIKLGPPYYNHYGLRNNLKNAAARAGASTTFTDANIRMDVKRIAGENGILLEDENITVNRSRKQEIIINVDYNVPVDFIIMKRDINFKASGTGTRF